MSEATARRVRSVALMSCGHWKETDATVGRLHAFCGRCDVWRDVEATADVKERADA